MTQTYAYIDTYLCGWLTHGKRPARTLSYAAPSPPIFGLYLTGSSSYPKSQCDMDPWKHPHEMSIQIVTKPPFSRLTQTRKRAVVMHSLSMTWNPGKIHTKHQFKSWQTPPFHVLLRLGRLCKVSIWQGSPENKIHRKQLSKSVRMPWAFFVFLLSLTKSKEYLSKASNIKYRTACHWSKSTQRIAQTQIISKQYTFQMVGQDCFTQTHKAKISYPDMLFPWISYMYMHVYVVSICMHI